MPLTDHEKACLNPRSVSEYAQGFRAGANCEARERREDILPHLRKLFETVEVMCQNYTDRTPSQVTDSIYYIFHEPPKQNWIQRHTRLWAAILVALAVVLVGIDEGRHSTWPVAIAYMGGVVAGMAATVYFLTPKGKKHGR